MNRLTLTRSFVKALPFFIIVVLLAMSVAGGRNVVASGPSLLATGGPDGFGYTYIDSNELGGPAFSWEDISGTGTPLTPIAIDWGWNTDDGAWNRSNGFAFNFYGTNYNQVAVSSNGFLNFNSGGGDFYPGDCDSDCPIPDTDEPNTAIYGFWDDLDPSEGGEIYVETRGVAPDRRFIVQYQNVPFYDTSVPVTFQIVLFEGSDNILMQYQYIGRNPYGEWDTEGIEAPGGTDGLQYENCHAAQLANGLAVLFVARYPVGGIAVPVDRLGLLAPWMGLAALVSLAAITIAVVRRRRG